MRDLIFEDQHRHSKHVETVFSLHVKLTVNFFLSFDLSVDGFIVGALLAVENFCKVGAAGDKIRNPKREIQVKFSCVTLQFRVWHFNHHPMHLHA
jgi:hypothetical protein